MVRRTASKWGEATPEWLRKAETYGEAPSDWRLINEAKWDFVTHVPHSEEYLRALRAKGIRGFPYMSFYQAPIHGRWQEYRLSEHTDWIEIDKNGNWRRTGFWESEDSKNWYCTCCNAKEFTDVLMAYVARLMKAGAGGIFLDNVHINPECFGLKYGAHKHLYASQIEAFTMLLKRTRELICSYDPQGALLVNSADPVTLPEPYWKHTDCEMSESFICTWVSSERWGDWHKTWNQLDKQCAGPLKAGKQICCLSYLGHTPYSIKDDAFFCYASARLMNLIWTAGGDVLAGNEASILYRVRTGQPVTAEQVASNGIHFRLFQDGLVAVNPTNRNLTLQVEHAFPTRHLWDVYNNAQVEQKAGRVSLSIPKQSGRVYIWNPTRESTIPATTRHILTIKTEPGLGKTQFKVDGIPLWTHSGRWTTEYVKGPNYGAAVIDFDKPGVHTVEAVDLERKELLVATSYEAAYLLDETEMPGQVREKEEGRLGVLMDPSEPTQFTTGAPFRFQRWSGAASATSPTIRLKVSRPTALIAHYRRTTRHE